ncbi:hypothetical protein RK21_04427 [Pseudomonas plecoglossicida]|nr:hypothetical protein RK21_04427 [Pseudomonas plecoglossicida]
MGAGLPAKKTTRCMAPALPVFAGEPAPTRVACEACFNSDKIHPDHAFLPFPPHSPAGSRLSSLKET